MALATRCPVCETIFRISTIQAAAKSGMVRCGECRNVFNSLDALVRVEDLDLEEPPHAEPPHATREAHSPTHVDHTAHRIDAGDLAFIPPSEYLNEPLRPTSSTVPDADAPKPPEDAVFKEWWLPEDDASAPNIPQEPATASAADRARRSGVSSGGRRRIWSGPPPDRRTSPGRPNAAGHDIPEFARGAAPRAARARSERWMLGVLSIVAAVALAGQGAYVYRDWIGAYWPVAKPWLATACLAIRCAVDYPAHLEAISIESTAMQTSAPTSNSYTLTALLRNSAPVAVRYPHLELTLTDTQDQPVLRRALRPEDYLSTSRYAAPGLQAGFPAASELSIRVTFELNDSRFVGYRLERFYP